MPQVKTDGHGLRDVAYEPAQPAEADQRQENTRHGNGEQQAIEAILADRCRYEDDESAGRPADLKAAASQRGH